MNLIDLSDEEHRAMEEEYQESDAERLEKLKKIRDTLRQTHQQNVVRSQAGAAGHVKSKGERYRYWSVVIQSDKQIEKDLKQLCKPRKCFDFNLYIVKGMRVAGYTMPRYKQNEDQSMLANEPLEVIHFLSLLSIGKFVELKNRSPNSKHSSNCSFPSLDLSVERHAA